MGKLTDQQRLALGVFERQPRRWFSPQELAEALGNGTWQGASITAASLVKRGKLIRGVHHGRVHWRRA